MAAGCLERLSGISAEKVPIKVMEVTGHLFRFWGRTICGGHMQLSSVSEF